MSVVRDVKRPLAVLGVLCVAAALLGGCSARRQANGAAVVVVAPPVKVALPNVPAPPDDPARDWHTFSPEPYEGGPFYKVVDLNVTAPSVYGGPCGLGRVEG